MASDFHLHEAIGFRRNIGLSQPAARSAHNCQHCFTLLLLAITLVLWRSFYIDRGPPDSELRIMTRHKVSLANFLPIYDRDKIRAVPGVLASLTQQNPACVAHKEANSPWR
jgi:hypothetical protein